MTATETLHPELTADLVERVANLSPEAFDRLRELRDTEAKLDAEYDTACRDQIRAVTVRVLTGEEPMVDWQEALAELKATQTTRDGR